MAIDNLLSKLDHVRRTNHGRWIAKCPAHDDSRASLSIRELDDGRVLIHDFAGCSTENVLGAVGLTFSDLMPEVVSECKRKESRPFSAADALRCVSFEVMLVATYANKMAGGQKLGVTDKERLLLASSRIRGALQGAGL
ncbi:hypothetical protein [Methylotenera sp. L2L1]|uniref:hypothetical protein n=1 Tax=Methylotenera sp. L2L1 TaxID=1502770 RepID=UPI0005620663|nr:hypothetical protein [Methylotenera sp. L2L1]